MEETFRANQAHIDSVQAEARKKEAREKTARKKKLIEKYGEEIGTQLFDKTIWIGMTAEMARDGRGDPKEINRTVTSSMVHEQWVYEGVMLQMELEFSPA
jgi:hypothetical protein